jgi:hypothetical protein
VAWRELVGMVTTALMPDEFARLWEIAEDTSYEDAAVGRD